MKKQLLYTILFLIPILLNAQIDAFFGDNTFYNWTNTDGSTTMLTYEMHPNIDDGYIQKVCDGTNTAVGEMAFKVIPAANESAFNGEYGMDIFFTIKNENSFPLYIRFGFKGANDAEIITLEPVVVPAFSDWVDLNSTSTGGGLYPGIYDNFHVVSSGNYDPNVGVPIVQHTLGNVAEFRVIHNQALSFDGEIVTGTLQMDSLFTFIPLSVKENFLSEIKIYPNPVADQLFINFPHAVKGKLTITSIDGKQLLTQELKAEQMQLDLSNIKSKGIYFLKIETPKGTITKKIIKA
ncbi:T9SS type A sorting domain-containing protein [uncultured Kordia sp.]|uniref:T9SS type A sorting domain-containing protein n=1 Tax=uncultured Kordia sp. TaxID=507699 RepID=UPI00262F784C|nr:T9SS type A sorting domain-containing protein [uncultured Kordia sp.]